MPPFPHDSVFSLEKPFKVARIRCGFLDELKEGFQRQHGIVVPVLSRRVSGHCRCLPGVEHEGVGWLIGRRAALNQFLIKTVSYVNPTFFVGYLKRPRGLRDLEVTPTRSCSFFGRPGPWVGEIPTPSRVAEACDPGRFCCTRSGRPLGAKGVNRRSAAPHSHSGKRRKENWFP